jgi:hypothetical protein
VAAALAAADERRREADDLVSNASRVQAQVLASIEQARSSLSTPGDLAPEHPEAEQPLSEQPAEPQHAPEHAAQPVVQHDPWGPPAEQPRSTPLQSLLGARADEPVESDPAAQRADEADATDAAA